MALVGIKTESTDTSMHGSDSIAGPAGTLARPRMLAAAAPTTSMQVSAMIVMALVKPFSVYFASPINFPISGKN